MTSIAMKAIPATSSLVTPNAATLIDWSALAGRVALAVLFLWSGYGKLAYMNGNIGYMNAHGAGRYAVD